ncbi:HD domain-containing protein [Candidatus Parcubacteria bacterium]|nr:HD domain-containing protein [Candidatus Parcubacteria bacterium]
MTKDLKFYEFIKFLNKLKEEKRFVGVKGIKGDNSADHTWRLAMMVFMTTEVYDIKINLLKAIKIALIHDLVEIIAKDITRADRVKKNISDNKKIKEERAAMKKIKKMAPLEIGQEIEDLWEEYVERKTKEAKIVASLDKIEGLMTFFEKSKPRKYYADYIATYSNPYFKDTPELKKLYTQLQKEMKSSYYKNNIKWKKEYENI